MIHDAEKLLGGYATGTLTEAERRELFAAALEHQALFEALADEEALRELLADPSARAELLKALAEAPAPKIRPFWRRHPGALGLAASLLLAVTAGLAYLRGPHATEHVAPATPQLTEPQAKPDLERQSAPPPPQEQAPARGTALQKQRAPAPLELRSKPRAIPEAPAAAPSTWTKPEAAPSAPAPAPAPAEEKAKVHADSAGARTAVAKEEAEGKQAKRMRERVTEAPAPNAAVGGALSAGSAAGASAQTQAHDSAGALPKGRTLEAAASLAPGVVAGPSWTFVKGYDGRHRLRLTHPAGTHAYLIRRRAQGPERLPAMTEPASGQRILVTYFLLPKEAGAMDIYVFAAPAADPLKLPAEGPVEGFRARVEGPRP